MGGCDSWERLTASFGSTYPTVVNRISTFETRAILTVTIEVIERHLLDSLYE